MVFGVVSPAFAAGFTPQNHLQKAAESELIADNGKLKAKLSLPKTEKREARPMMQALVNRSRKTPLRTGAEPGFGETKVTVNIAKHGIGSNEFAFDKVFGSGAKKTITLYDDADEAATPEQTVTFTSGDNVVEFTTPIPMQHVKAGDVYIEFEGTHVAGKLTWEESDPSYSGGTNVTTYKLDLYQVRNTDVIVKTVDAEGTEVANPKTGKIKLGSLGKEIAIPVKGTTGVFTGKNIRVKDVDKLNDDPNYSVERLESGVLVNKDANKVYKPTIGTPDPDGLRPTEITFTEKPIVTETEPKIDDPENPGTQITDPDYVAVTFAKGDHGKIATNKTYYVFKGVTMDSTLTPPKVTADEGYQFTGWEPVLAKKYDENTTHKAEYTKDTCLTQLALKKQFEEAANPMFEGVAQRKDAYIGKFDETTHTVTVAIIDKDAKLTEMSGSGLIAGLTKLYKENKLTKIKISENDPIDLNAVWEYAKSVLPEADKNNEEKIKASFMGNLKVLIGGHVGNTLKNGVALDLNKDTLELFIDKEVKLNLTIEQPGCGNATNIVYTIKGVEAASSLLKNKLDPQDISVWVGDEISWKDGVKLKEADEDLQAILDKAKVTDLGENGTEEEPKTARTSAAKGKFTGNLLVTFEDGSKLVVENQNLYVRAEKEEITDENKEWPLPEDGLEVQFKAGEGVKKDAEGKDLIKTVLFKAGTKLEDTDFPAVKLETGYTEPAKWTGNGTNEGFIVSKTNNVFTAKATAKAEFTDDEIIPYTPGEDEPTKGDDGKDIPDNYITVTFKSEDVNKGTVKVETKEGAEVKAKVKPGTNLSGKAEALAKDGYGFTVWAPELGVAADGNEYTAKFIKDGSEVGKDDPIPTGWHKVTVKQDNTIQSGTVTEKTYAVAPKDEAKGQTGKLAADKFPSLDKKEAEGYENPAWYKDAETKATVDPSAVEITGDTTFTAKATNIAPPVNKSEKPTIDQPTVGDDKITGKGVAGATIVVKDNNGDEIGSATVDQNGDWEVTVPGAKPLVKGETITATQTETGKIPSEPAKTTVKDKTTPTPQGPSVTYPDTDIDKGDTKTITPDIKDKDGNPTTPKDIPDVVQPGNGVIVTPHKDGSIDVTVPEDYDGPGTITVDVTVRVDGKDINTTLTIRVNSGDDNDRPEHDGGDIFDGLFKRHDYTPTYPVKTVVPEKTKEINKLWYIFHIDEYDYEEVRNYNSTSHKMDVTPVIRNERTMLPLRYVAEAINADVIWNAETRTATFTKDGLTASIQIDSDEIVLSNGKTVKMDSKPLNINDRILVSVVNVANVFGMTNGHTLDGTDQDIEWNQNDKSATIYVRR